MPSFQWQIQPPLPLPDWFVEAVSQHTGDVAWTYVAQLLWQRGMREPAELAGFLNADRYDPASPFEFGQEMQWAVTRLDQALQNSEKVAIWGDFDADGITATAVLWEGLGQFFAPQYLTYYIPNRLTESHGLSIAGLTQLADWGCSLIVTCDTGSTCIAEIAQAQKLEIDIIITDHHTLPAARPPVSAIVNPRYLPAAHPLADLSGVAVAYKLVEALYETLPAFPQRPLSALLDLVAIGLIADLVRLTGDCRYLAQRGIAQLQQHQNTCPAVRPGISKLLEFCKRNGDRPTDISFGLGPRINAISRIHGDARFCVELLTSQNVDRCQVLAEDTELANTRRKSLQKDVAQQVRAKLTQVDLSTTDVIVLADPQWSVGILGLVAGQIAQEYGCPTILLSTEETDPDMGEQQPETSSQENPSIQNSPLPLARGSARSVNSIDLYQLVKQQAHLLHRFGGHPLAMGLSLAVENLPLFTEAINRQMRQQQCKQEGAIGAVIQADLRVTVAELGKDLFRQLKLLEPCGIGNPVPKLLIENAWFTQVWNRNIQDHRGQKIRYIKTEFEICDDTADPGFPGIWWDHYKDEIPIGRCDAIVELDFNPHKKRYEIRLLAVRPAVAESQTSTAAAIDWILDWRGRQEMEDRRQKAEGRRQEAEGRGQKAEGRRQEAEGRGQRAEGRSNTEPQKHQDTKNSSPSPHPTPHTPHPTPLQIPHCPTSWDEFQSWLRRRQPGQKLALAYSLLPAHSPIEVWQQFVGVAKYLSRSGQSVTQLQLQEKLGIGDRALRIGLIALQSLGLVIRSTEAEIYITWQSPAPIQDAGSDAAIEQFLAVVQEEQFRRRYFYEAPLATLQAVAHQLLRG